MKINKNIAKSSSFKVNKYFIDFYNAFIALCYTFIV